MFVVQPISFPPSTLDLWVMFHFVVTVYLKQVKYTATNDGLDATLQNRVRYVCNWQLAKDLHGKCPCLCVHVVYDDDFIWHISYAIQSMRRGEDKHTYPSTICVFVVCTCL